MKVTVQAELAIPAKTYFLERDGAAFRSFIAEEMNLQEYEIVQCWKEGSSTLAKLNSKPDVSAWVPSSLAKKVPDLEYFDVVQYDPAKLAEPPYELHVRSEAPFLRDKASFRARLWIEPLGPDRCRHTLEQTIEFSGMFGLGSVAKKLAKKSLQQSFEDMPRIIDKWVQLRQELLQTPRGRRRLLAGRPKVEGVQWMEEEEAAILQEDLVRPSKRRHRQHRKGGPGTHHVHAVAGAGGMKESQPPVQLSGGAAASGTAVAFPERSAFDAASPEPMAGAACGAGDQKQEQQQPQQRQGEKEQEKHEEFVDAAERMGRLGGPAMSTGGSVYFTPAASLAPSVASELPLPPPPAGADAAAAPGGQQQQPQGRVQVQRVTAEGEPLPGMTAAGEAAAPTTGSGHAGAEGGIASPFALSTSPEEEASQDYSSGSEESEGEEERWAHTAAWRSLYAARGIQPMHRLHTLPPALVRKLTTGRRPRPVEVEKVQQAAAGSASHGGTRRKLKSMLTSCMGGSAGARG